MARLTNGCGDNSHSNQTPLSRNSLISQGCANFKNKYQARSRLTSDRSKGLAEGVRDALSQLHRRPRHSPRRGLREGVRDALGQLHRRPRRGLWGRGGAARLSLCFAWGPGSSVKWESLEVGAGPARLAPRRCSEQAQGCWAEKLIAMWNDHISAGPDPHPARGYSRHSHHRPESHPREDLDRLPGLKGEAEGRP